ncbi:hypothetical protein PLICRDRAFT_53504 [Plicaturopsis crispa FD-325 SS-3]|nr:hypothetical protein PLICRDRAFT_53504 [Plicaturopsis crispa FD-325 SS-3]
MDAHRIPIHVSNHRAYVWDVDDIAALRARHNICGLLTGTLPHLSQQNVFLGIPLVLMPEEVVLLVEKELAILIDDPSAHTAPSRAALEEWNNGRLEDIRMQIAQAGAKEEAKAPKSREAATSEAAQRKRREREERRAREKAAAANADTLFVPPPQPAPEQQQPAPVSTTVLVPATSAAFAWYSPAPATYATLDSARRAGVWAYPATAHERAKCGVFRDLWERGNFMGGGIKFGGDYLVYPGDPLRYHSHFTATVLDAPTTALRPMEIVAHGRLGTATKKAHLLCGWDEKAQAVDYYSIEWAGFG